MNAAPPTAIDAAQAYAKRGWQVLPLHWIQNGTCTCSNAECNSPGKHPRTANGLKDATTDRYQIADWWREWPDANVGIVTGEVSGFVVIDIDGTKGNESLDKLEGEHGTLPATVTACTGGGGLHFLFRHPGITIRNRTNLRTSIDVRGDGGYIVAPPSNHVNGGTYRWDEQRAPDEVELAELPGWLLELLTSKPQPQPERNGAPPSSHGVLLQRAQQYAARADAASEGSRNDAAFRLSGHVAAFTDAAGSRLNEGEVLDVMRSWNYRNSPPLAAGELQQCVTSALSNGTPRPTKVVMPSGGLDRLIFGKPGAQQSQPEVPGVEKFTLVELQTQYPKLPPPVIDGLARVGETINIIAPTKVGKSWLVDGLALSIITGRPWLETFEVAWGRVLLIDNELHRPTIVHRLAKVGEAMGLVPDDYNVALDVWPLRGNLCTLFQLGADFGAIERGYYKLIILDAKYRFATPGISENDNDPVLYNLLDQYAAQTGAAIVVIHHSTKGSQAEKRVTDVGAGGGVQSRAADCHLILREHEDDDVFVLDAAVRSFPPVEPIALRWNFPLWYPAESVDPRKLKGKLTATERRQGERDQDGIDKITKALEGEPATASQLRSRTGLSHGRQQRLLDIMTSERLVTNRQITNRGNLTNEYQLQKNAH